MSTPRPRSRRVWGTTIAVGLIAIGVNVPWFNALLVSFKTEADIARSPLPYGFGRIGDMRNFGGGRGPCV